MKCSPFVGLTFFIGVTKMVALTPRQGHSEVSAMVLSLPGLWVREEGTGPWQVLPRPSAEISVGNVTTLCLQTLWLSPPFSGPDHSCGKHPTLGEPEKGQKAKASHPPLSSRSEGWLQGAL